MGQIWDFLRSLSVHFGLGEPNLRSVDEGGVQTGDIYFVPGFSMSNVCLFNIYLKIIDNIILVLSIRSILESGQLANFKGSALKQLYLIRVILTEMSRGKD